MFFKEKHFYNFSIFIIIDRYILLLHSWIVFLASGTLQGILRMSFSLLHPRNRTHILTQQSRESLLRYLI